jgi:hypothetical protein
MLQKCRFDQQTFQAHRQKGILKGTGRNEIKCTRECTLTYGLKKRRYLGDWFKIRLNVTKLFHYPF